MTGQFENSPAIASSTLIDAPLKVLLWSPRGAGLHYGGPGMTAYKLYGVSDRDTLCVDLAHGYGEQGNYPLFGNQYCLGSASHGRLQQLRFIRAARQWLRANASRYDVFHGLQAFDLTVTPAHCAELCGLPAVVKVAAYRSDLRGSRLSRLTLAKRRRIQRLHEISAIIAISTEIYEECLELGIPEHSVSLIPNGVNTEAYAPLRNAEEIRALRRSLNLLDLPTVVFTGGVTRRKQPHRLVEAVGRLRGEGQDVQLLLVGPAKEHDYSQYLNSLIERHGLENLVRRVGFTTNVIPYLQAAEVFALPSMNEGMANAVLEAMSCGLPSILTAVSGTRDFFARGPIGTVCDGSVEELTAAIRAYVENLDLQASHGDSARSMATDCFDARKVLQRHVELFRLVAARKRDARRT